MKLKREQFNPLRLSIKQKCKGKCSKPTDEPNEPEDDLEPIDDDDIESDDSKGDDEEDDDSEESTEQDDEGDEDEESDAGAMLTPEESKDIQEKLGVPVELPDETTDEKMAQASRQHLDKLTSGTQGTGKGNSLRLAILRLTEPIVDWKSALKRFIGKAMSTSELHLGSRRHLHSGDYFYGEKHKFDALSNCVVAVDTSGSMTAEAIELILNEVKGIIKAKKIKHTEIVYFDDGLQGIDKIDGPNRVFDYKKIKGGGGTSFLEPLQYMEQAYKKGKLNLAVFMTDGIARLDHLPTPKWKNIFVWVILDNPGFKAPFGHLVVNIAKSQVKENK